MKKESSRNRNISFIKRKYFYKNSTLTNEQIGKILNVTNDYLKSINLSYGPKNRISILQSTISLIVHNYNLNSEEKDTKSE